LQIHDMDGPIHARIACTASPCASTGVVSNLMERGGRQAKAWREEDGSRSARSWDFITRAFGMSRDR
jgi:hypothetical protein